MLVTVCGMIFLAFMLFVEGPHIFIIHREYNKLLDACYLYLIDCLRNEVKNGMSMNDIPNSIQFYTNYRIWSYKQMLPPDKIELIKPYIGKKVEV